MYIFLWLFSFSYRELNLGLRLWPFGSILRTSLLAILNTLGVERSSNNVIPDPWKVFHSPTSDEDDRVFLKIVSLTRDVRRDLDTAHEADTRNFPERRIGLLRCRGVYSCAYSPPLRTLLERGGLAFPEYLLATVSN